MISIGRHEMPRAGPVVLMIAAREMYEGNLEDATRLSRGFSRYVPPVIHSELTINYHGTSPWHTNKLARHFLRSCQHEPPPYKPVVSI